jgi:hypothetical protein
MKPLDIAPQPAPAPPLRAPLDGVQLERLRKLAADIEAALARRNQIAKAASK